MRNRSKKKKIKNKNRKNNYIINYVLMALVVIGIVWNILSEYNFGNLTTLLGIVYIVFGSFVIYSLYKRMKWVYIFVIVMNLLALIIRSITLNYFYTLSLEGIWSIVIILLSYSMLNKLNPKKYKKLPWIKI